ncbi:uncharacterized protein BS16045_01464 [Bacillus subtilis]|nr:uncharacterized protein BS16045_01464 [Bacillus subtilis]
MSFIYTVTVIIVIVFAIEIQQKVTGRGNMEFLDATEGIKGFLVFFMFFLLLKMLLRFIKILFSGRPASKSNGNTRSRR